MQRAQNGAVAQLFAQGGDDLQHRLKVCLTQLRDAHFVCDGVHLVRHGGIFVRQVGMVAADIHDAQRIAGRGKIEIELFDHRLFGVGKVDGDDAADRGSHLIEQSARLAEIDIFGILGDLGDVLGRHLAVVAQMAQNDADEHFKRRR